MKERFKALGKFTALFTLATACGYYAYDCFKDTEYWDDDAFNIFVRIFMIGINVICGVGAGLLAMILYCLAVFIEFPVILTGKREPETEEIEA